MESEGKAAQLEAIAWLVKLANQTRNVIESARLVMEAVEEEDAKRIVDEALRRWRLPPDGPACG